MIALGLIFILGFTVFLLRVPDAKKKRRIVSLTLFITSIIMPVSGFIVHITHNVGNEFGINVEGVFMPDRYGSKLSHNFLHIHVVFGFIFIVACIFHIVLNWKTMKYFLVGKNKN